MSEDLALLVKRMKEKDADAFDRIFEHYHNQLFRMAYLISGNYADSEDIVQETFVKCYCNCKKLNDCAAFPSWLYQILTRTAWNYSKKQGREKPAEILFEKGEPQTGNQPLNEVLKQEVHKQLYDAICQLDIKQRTVIVLYYFNQLSIREISRVMGCMEGTVKSRLHAARKNLEQSLKKEDPVWKAESWIV